MSGLNGHSRPKPCCKRLDNGGWCSLHDGHQEPCEGVAAQYHPYIKPPEKEGLAQKCCKVTGPATVCNLSKGHQGDCK